MNTKVSRQDKINKVIQMVDTNPKIDFDPETTTFSIVPCNCNFITDFNTDLNDILYQVNSYILEKNYRFNYEIALLGNFGAFIIKKLQELTKDNEKLIVLSTGDIDLHDLNLTIKLNLFQPFKTILKHINETIQDVEKNRHVKIGRVKYLHGSIKTKMNGKRTT